MAAIRVVDIREIPSADPARVGKLDMIVTYQTDKLNTYITVIPKEEFTEAALIEKIRAEMKERETWIGKELVI